LKKNSSLQEYELWKLKNKTNSILAERYEINGKVSINEAKGKNKYKKVYTVILFKEASEFSLSPQSSSMNSLDEFSNYAEKLFPVGKLNWSELHKDEDIKIRHWYFN